MKPNSNRWPHPRRATAIVVGGLFWALLITAGLYANRRPQPDSEAELSSPTVGSQLAEYWTSPKRRIELTMPEVPAKDGDPIFGLTREGNWIQAGYLVQTDSQAIATRATAVWHSSELTPSECRFEYHRNRGKFADIVKLLLPPEKRARVEEIIRQAVARDGEAIAEAMRPIITRSMQQSLPAIENAFRNSIANHRTEIEKIGERYRSTVLEGRLVPLLKDEVLPIVKKHAEPLAQEIGRELWDRASVWRFGWRFVYDSAPLPERDLVKREWDRFVEQDAIPVLESHTDDMLQAQRNILRDISKNQDVRDELSELASEIARDKELQEIVLLILRETIVDNQELRQVWIDQWQSAEAKVALKMTGDRLEPLVREIGDELFGTRDGGISPSFARVLRNQILGKDKRWLVAVYDADASEQETPYPVSIGESGLQFPLIIMATPDTDNSL